MMLWYYKSKDMQELHKYTTLEVVLRHKMI